MENKKLKSYLLFQNLLFLILLTWYCYPVFCVEHSFVVRVWWMVQRYPDRCPRSWSPHSDCVREVITESPVQMSHLLKVWQNHIHSSWNEISCNRNKNVAIRSRSRHILLNHEGVEALLWNVCWHVCIFSIYFCAPVNQPCWIDQVTAFIWKSVFEGQLKRGCVSVRDWCVFQCRGKK